VFPSTYTIPERWVLFNSQRRLEPSIVLAWRHPQTLLIMLQLRQETFHQPHFRRIAQSTTIPQHPQSDYIGVPKSACRDARVYTEDIIHSSMGLTPVEVKPQKNGFVHTILECYNHHRALTLRLDDAWFSCFVNGNTEAL